MSEANEKPDNLEELGQREPYNLPQHLEIDPPDGGFQAWVTAFGW